MQYLKKFRYAISTCLLLSGVVSVLHWQRPLPGARAAASMQFDVSALVHGLVKAPGLPDGDVFLLPQPIKLTIGRPPESAALFTVNRATFGDEAPAMGGLPTVPARGFSLSTPGETTRALLCAESIWDGNLFLAANGAVGDTVRLFVQYGDGTGVQDLLNFTAETAGYRLSDIHSHLKLFVDNRFALGPDTKKGALIPFVDDAGPRGQRTGLLTFAFPMDFDSPLHGCFQLGIEIKRAQTDGKSSIVVADLVVMRNKVAGDEANPGEGLLGKLTGGYPSGLPCKADCPATVDNQPTPTPVPVEVCKTICFRSPQHFYLMYCHRPEVIPFGAVMIGGVNYNRPVGTRTMQVIVAMRAPEYTPLQWLNREFIAAQLNVLNAGGDGSPNVFHAMEGFLYCYGLSFDPITLSNGFVLSPQTKLKDLFEQTRFSIFDNRTGDMAALARVWDLLNGNNTLGDCNN